jgi:outer membrane protein OmpA-like peptidoglycan-associated protein
MKSDNRYRYFRGWCYLLCTVLLAGVGFAASPGDQAIASGQKGKVKGKIVSRSGDLVKVREKSGDTVTVVLTDTTKIERDKGAKHFFRHSDMDATAMLPGLTIDAEGVGNAKNQLEASKITFNPDAFAVEVAQEQQIESNKSAAEKAQTSANQAGAAATAAGAEASMDADAIAMVNKRVSDLGDYKTVAEAQIYFPVGGTTLDDAAKADLATLASAAKPVQGYLVEIAGYASSTGSKEENQKLSEERAASVVQYLREQGNIPMRRILVPAGYGATHPEAPNTDSQGRALNRRADVKVIVNKGLAEGD